MINITLSSNSQAILEGPELDIIREHFSVKNEAAHFQRRFGRYVPQRTYVITKQGKTDVGLLIEIARFCKIKDIKINFSKETKNILIPTLRKDNIIDYNYYPTEKTKKSMSKSKTSTGIWGTDCAPSTNTLASYFLAKGTISSIGTTYPRTLDI